MSDTIKALDGCTLNVDGVSYPVPTGTEIQISVGNDKGIAITDHEIDGDGEVTEKYKKIVGKMTGVVVRLRTGSLEDQFNNLFSESNQKVNLTNGDTIYSISKALFKSPQEDSTPNINQTSRATEAFEIISKKGKIQRSSV